MQQFRVDIGVEFSDDNGVAKIDLEVEGRQLAIIETNGEVYDIENYSEETDSRIVALAFQVMSLIMADYRRKEKRAEFHYTRIEA